MSDNSNVVDECQFRLAMKEVLRRLDFRPGAVTGPGRSGAIASVYASHFLGVPWIPYGQPCPDSLKPLLIIDTASKTGRTLRKAWAKYGKGEDVKILAVIHEPPRVRFWYEASKQHDRESVARDRMIIRLSGARGAGPLVSSRETTESSEGGLREMGITQPIDEDTEDLIYDDFWRPILEKDGVLDVGQLKRELFDYYRLMGATTKVYAHVTGGMATKPNTDPDLICALADDFYSENVYEISPLAWDGLSAETIYGHAEVYCDGGKWRWRLLDREEMAIINRIDDGLESQELAKNAAFEAHKRFLLEFTIE